MIVNKILKLRTFWEDSPRNAGNGVYCLADYLRRSRTTPESSTQPRARIRAHHINPKKSGAIKAPLPK